MERSKGSFVLNNSRDTFTGRAKAIHVVSPTVFNSLADTKRNTLDYYVAATAGEIPTGTVIAARDGALFNSILLTSGAVEIIF